MLEPVVEIPATVVARARVSRVWRPCPTYARIAFRGPELEAFGTPGHTFDQRIKVLFPPAHGRLPRLGDADGAGTSPGAAGSNVDWYSNWLALPEPDRGAMRTYSIRELRVDAHGTEVIIDFVLHTAPGATGPASLWASAAQPGDEVLLVGPRRGRFDGGGIEFDPGQAPRVLLAGDETAAPAIARILEDAAPDLVGDAFIEVPGAGQSLPIAAPRGVRVHWLSRADGAPGSLLVPTVLHGLGAPTLGATLPPVSATIRAGSADESAGDAPDLVWETPGFSALGETLESDGSVLASRAQERYYWIAGESRVVTTLRRHLVRDLGVHRSQVAFMGYWREGVAMK